MLLLLLVFIFLILSFLKTLYLILLFKTLNLIETQFKEWLHRPANG
jgi:hypothetical protein